MDKRNLQERDRVVLTRRRLSLGLCLGALGTFAGCSGSSEDPPLDDRAVINPDSGVINPSSTTNPLGAATKASNASWEVVPNNALALSAGATFDLARTLPSSAPPGGRFDVDASGAPLPAGITLLPSGLLSVAASATGSTAGVVFRYTPPA